MLRFEWPTLHECVLQKRRNEIKKRKSGAGQATAEAVPQTIEQEHFDE